MAIASGWFPARIFRETCSVRTVTSRYPPCFEEVGRTGISDLAPRPFLLAVRWLFLRQALRLKPEYPKVVLRKARLHARLEEWDLAIEVRRAVTVFVGRLCSDNTTGTQWTCAFEVPRLPKDCGIQQKRKYINLGRIEPGRESVLHLVSTGGV